MPDASTVYLALVFVVAGMVKGIIGLGLPTISIGLLAIAMPPAQAAAILVVPSIVTNVWQALAGPALKALVARLWPMMVGTLAGLLLGVGWLTGPGARLASIWLGVVLVIYAVIGLAKVRFVVAPARERLLGPLVGLATGLVTAATGVFVVPAVPYLQAIGLEKEELVQALGLFFLVSTVGLALNLALSGVAAWDLGPLAMVALAAALLGMWVGQRVRARLSQAAFRTAFFLGTLALGAYLATRGLI